MGKDAALTVSYSRMATYRRCLYKYYLNYVENLKPPVGSLGQIRGSAGHAALANWYSKGKDNERAMQTAWRTFQKEGGVDPEDFEPLREALERYFDWAEVGDKWEVQAVEKKFDFELEPGLRLMGYMDMIVEQSGHIWVVENKFLKQVSTGHLDLDPQVSTYMLGAFACGIQPVGVIYNIIRMSSGPTAQQDPVVRKLLYRNKEGLRAKLEEIKMQGRAMATFENEGGDIYRNETRDCSWDCPYFQVCLGITDNGSSQEMIDVLRREYGR